MGSVTLVGLGAMGSALAKALVNGGQATTVWNRTQSKIDEAVAIGAIGAASVVEAVDANDIILVCMSNYSATRSMFDTDAVRGHLTGKTLVQMGTGTPSEGRDSEYWIREMGGDYLDVIIQPYPEDIGKSDSRLFISGSEKAYEIALPFMKLFGGDLRYLGENVGAANTLDLAKLTYWLGKAIGFAHAARICEVENIGLDQFASLFKEHEPARDLADMVHANSYAVDAIHPGASIKTWEGCIQLIQTHARLNEMNCEVPDLLSTLFNRAIDSGFEEEDVAAIVKVLRQK